MNQDVWQWNERGLNQKHWVHDGLPISNTALDGMMTYSDTWSFDTSITAIAMRAPKW
jgi:hypothetical protein